MAGASDGTGQASKSRLKEQGLPAREDLIAALKMARDEMRQLQGNIVDLGRSDYRNTTQSSQAAQAEAVESGVGASNDNGVG